MGSSARLLSLVTRRHLFLMQERMLFDKKAVSICQVQWLASWLIYVAGIISEDDIATRRFSKIE